MGLLLARSEAVLRLALIAIFATLAVTASSAIEAAVIQAETLQRALVRTYNSNPVITAERAGVRALDEGVAIARAAGRPQLFVNMGFNRDLVRTGGGSGRNVSGGADFSYPLFSGGRVRNAIGAARARVEAGRAGLTAVEGDVFTEAVAAYMDVIRDRAIVALHENLIRALEVNLEASKAGYTAGDLTVTDIAQSEARLMLAKAALATARGQLTTREENYRRVIGSWPGQLSAPPPLPRLPATPEQAVDLALRENADLLAIRDQIRAAAFDVGVARADRLPSLSAVSSATYVNYLGSARERFGVPGIANTQTSAGVGVQARVPLFQGGRVGSRVRQAQAIQSQLLERSIAVERSVVAEVRATFSNHQAAKAAVLSNETAVEANRLALGGTREEQRVGTRTILDVLNAEQEMLSSDVELVSARRDEYVSGFALLNAMGKAKLQDLNLEGGILYDPAVNYRRVSRKASDWDDDPRPRPVATRTTEMVPAEPAVPISSPAATGAASQSSTQISLQSSIPVRPQGPRVSAGPIAAGQANRSPTPQPRFAGLPQKLPAMPVRAPARMPAAQHGYVVQLAAFSSERRALEASRAFALRHGFRTEQFLRSGKNFPGRGHLHRLAIGTYRTKAEAAQVCSRVKAKAGSCFIRKMQGDTALESRALAANLRRF